MANHRFKAAVAATALLLATPFPTLAQTQGADPHHAQSDARPAAPAGPGPGTMQGMPEDRMPDGMTMPMMDGSGANMETMDCPMMSEMMRMHPGMMSMMMRMHPEMMPLMHGRMKSGGEMMRQGPGSGMMMRQGGMDWDAGVVTAIQHLSTSDVRHYFEHRLDVIGNDRLKLGEVTSTDDDTITVEIVTVDNSLVDRLEVDPHSGRIERAE